MELEELLSDEEDEVDERFRNNYESGLEMVSIRATYYYVLD